MKIGIVGNNASKFTPVMETKARLVIMGILTEHRESLLVSGHCHQGGVDIWAEEIADSFDIPKIIYTPDIRQWNPYGKYGFKARNIDIASTSDDLNVIVARDYLPGYSSMRFGECYHCARHGRASHNHVKSGACWTLNEALKRGKSGRLHIIEVEK